MPPLHLYLLAYGFAIGHLRHRQRDFHTEFVLEPGYRHIQLLLTEPRKDLLMRFVVCRQREGGILLHQALQARGDLFLVPLILCLHRHRQARRLVRHARQHHRPRRCTQRITGIGRCQLGHRADVAGTDIGRFLLLFPADREHLADFLQLSGAHVHQRGIRRYPSAHHLEIQQLADKGVHHALKHNRNGLPVIADLEFHRIAIRIHTGFSRNRLRPGGQPGKPGEQLVHALKRSRRPAVNRCDVTAPHAGRQAHNQLIRGIILPREVFFHQLLAGFRNRLINRGAQPVETMPHVRQRHLRGLAVLIGIRLILQKIDIALHLPVHHIRHHQRADHRAKGRLQLLKYFIKIGVLIIQLVDEKQLGDALFAGRLKALFGADRHPAFPGNHDHRAACCTQPFAHPAGKVKQSRGVEQVHFGILPFHRYQRQGYRRFAAYLFRIKVTDRVAVRNAAEPVAFPGQIICGFRQRGLSRTGMPNQGDVADIFGAVLFQL